MRAILLFALSVGLSGLVQAQDAPTGVRGDALSTLQDVRLKAVALVDAFPGDKLAWRPTEGVRSVQEVLAHVAAANYFFGSMMGAAVPDGVNPREFEATITTSDALRDALNSSFDHMAGAIGALTADQEADQVEWFTGDKKSLGYVMMFTSIHAHEHLGQLIAYARTNQVIPPWSE